MIRARGTMRLPGRGAYQSAESQGRSWCCSRARGGPEGRGRGDGYWTEGKEEPVKGQKLSLVPGKLSAPNFDELPVE